MVNQKNRITELRKERGISSKDLAEKIGTSAPHMSRLEKGQSPLSLEWIAKIAAVLNVGSHEIVDIHLDKKFVAKCDDGLLSAVLGWVMEAADKYKVTLSRKDISKWASFVYNEVVDENLNFKQTKYLAFVTIKIIKKIKE